MYGVAFGSILRGWLGQATNVTRDMVGSQKGQRALDVTAGADKQIIGTAQREARKHQNESDAKAILRE
jgi:hypothetical protein